MMISFIHLLHLITALTFSTVCIAAGSKAPNAYPWRVSMVGTCWTDATCRRALTVSHGGDWNLEAPYDSLPAMKRAYADGSDSVKGDFRVSSDNVGVVCHSSPIEWYESPKCAGQRVEDMTVKEITSCPMALTNITFSSVPELLAWASEKVIVMLCVKRSEDLPRAISTLIENNATHRAFLEVHVRDLVNIVPTVPGWETVYYLAEGSTPDDLAVLLNASQAVQERAFAFEFEDYWKSTWKSNVTTVTQQELHPRNIHSFAATTELLPSVAEQVGMWQGGGVDVVYTYDTKNAVMARTEVDKARDINPP